MDILWMLIIGGIAGWLAGLIMQGRGFGLIGNIVVGIIGAILGSWIFGALNVGGGVFVTALIGSIVLLFLTGLVRREA